MFVCFGRFGLKLRTWKHEDVSMKVGFSGNKLKKNVLVLTTESMWLYDMLELEKEFVFLTMISRQSAWKSE